MSDLLPIVPGCLCLVIAAGDPKFIGMLGTVIGLEKQPWDNTAKWWSIDLPDFPSGSDMGYWQAKNEWIMRIDGHQPDEQDITTKEKENENV